MIDAGCALIDLETDEVVMTWPTVPARIEIPNVLRVDGADIGWVSTDKKFKLGKLVANDPPSESCRIVGEDLTVQYTTVKAKRAVADREYEEIPVMPDRGSREDRLKEIDAAESIDDIKAILRKFV